MTNPTLPLSSTNQPTNELTADLSWWVQVDISQIISIISLIVLTITLVVLTVTAYYARKAILEQSSYARKAIIEQSSINKKRAAIDLMILVKADKLLESAHPAIISIKKDNKDSIELYAHSDTGRSDDQVADAAKIRYLLNYYEVICVGINNNIYDEQIIIDSRLTAMTTAYNYTKSYIETVRDLSKKPTLHEHFENRVVDWQKRFPEKLSK